MCAVNVFLSSSFADRKVAAKLLEALRRKGLEVGSAAVGLERGEEFRRRVDDAIRAADLILVLVSPDHPDDVQQATWPEVLSAVWNDPSKQILPLLLRGASVPPFVHSSLREHAAIRLTDPADPQQLETASAAVRAAALSTATGAAPEHPRHIFREARRGGAFREAPVRGDGGGPPWDIDHTLEGDGGGGPAPGVDRMAEIERFVETLKDRS